MDAPRPQRASTIGLVLLAAAVLVLTALALRQSRSTGAPLDSLRSVDGPAASSTPGALPRSSVAPSPTATLTPAPGTSPNTGTTHHPGLQTATTRATASPVASFTPRPRPAPSGSSHVLTPSSSPSPTEHTTTIVISGYRFSPETLRIRVGETVTVTNTDADDHDLTSDEWTTGNLGQGQSQQHTFNAPGTYSYMCSIHPSMTGTIIVS